jgi:hypothetical protein
MRKERNSMNDPVNPDYYKKDYVMCIIEDFSLDFLSASVLKYVLRAGNKPGAAEITDLKKALWYLQRKIEGIENPRTNALHGEGV